MKTATLYRKAGLTILAIIFALSLSLIFNTSASAQRRGVNRGPVNSEIRLSRAMSYWNQQLNLTTQQQAQFKAILQTHFAKQDSIRNNFRGNPQAMHSHMLPIRNATHAELAKILTPEQQKNFTPLWGQRGRMMGGRNWNN